MKIVYNNNISAIILYTVMEFSCETFHFTEPRGSVEHCLRDTGVTAPEFRFVNRPTGGHDQPHMLSFRAQVGKNA
jgi:hypothetical protein